MGIATTNVLSRAMAARGAGPQSPVFEAHESVSFGGVLWLLPALESQGLYCFNDTHRIKQGYYSLTSIVLTLAIMALCRIKNPEQLKQSNAGELGRLLGLDRVPEVKCLRAKIDELSESVMTESLARQLSKQWVEACGDDVILYADGHVRIYNGYAANLTTKYVSRQKLCLSGTTEFWINDTTGMPVMYYAGELNERLQHVIEEQIIPNMIAGKALCIPDDIANTTTPVCTLVFDREAWEPAFFTRLWVNYRIAIITYRKHVKDQWASELFTNHTITKDQHTFSRLLYEQPLHIGGYAFREVRCLIENGHQVAMVTTHPVLIPAQVAGSMFNRWTQENFFKYQMSDYSFDHFVQYGTEPIELSKTVVNPEYSKISHSIKKEKEKLQRLQAELIKDMDMANDASLDQFKMHVAKQEKLTQAITDKKSSIEKLVAKRKKIPNRITLAQMPVEKRYNKLKTESRKITNIVKMVAYRAETATANMVAPYYKRQDDERRMLIKQIINSPASIMPDYTNNTLTVILNTLSSNRFNTAAQELANILNQTEAVFPGTNLKLCYKIQ
jgi:hypothetical protein